MSEELMAKVQRDMEGFGREYEVKRDQFLDLIDKMKITKKEALRLLKKITMFPLENEGEEVHLSSIQSKELFQVISDIYTIKQNMTIITWNQVAAETEMKMAEEAAKKAEEEVESEEVCNNCEDCKCSSDDSESEEE